MMEKMNPVVTALRDDIRRRQQVVQHIASLEEQLDSDRICGAWLAAQGTLTASLLPTAGAGCGRHAATPPSALR